MVADGLGSMLGPLLSGSTTSSRVTSFRLLGFIVSFARLYRFVCSALYVIMNVGALYEADGKHVAFIPLLGTTCLLHLQQPCHGAAAGACALTPCSACSIDTTGRPVPLVLVAHASFASGCNSIRPLEHVQSVG